MQQENFNRIQDLERHMDELSFEKRRFEDHQGFMNKIQENNDNFQNNYESKKILEENQSVLSQLKLKLKETELKNNDLEEKNRKLTSKLEEINRNLTNLQQKNEVLQQENGELLQQVDLMKDNTYSIEKEYDEKLYNFEKVLNFFHKKIDLICFLFNKKKRF